MRHSRLPGLEHAINTAEGRDLMALGPVPPRLPPGQNPAPDGPQNPGLPGNGDGDDDEVPLDDDPDGGARRPIRTAGSPRATPARPDGS